MMTNIRKSKLNRLPKLGLILLLLYFSQLYPYAHLHHSHNDDNFPVEISLQPLDIEIEELADHPEDEHHHHAIDQRIDWYAIRTGARFTVSTIDPPVICHGTGSVLNEEPGSFSRACTDAPLPDSVPLESFLCRGPPTVA